MTVFIVRVWLPDRPGALGAVASRVGAVRGDVIGIDIVERGADRAVDELVIDLPDPGLVDLMVSEIREVDGVDVEHFRRLDAAPADPAVLALDLAARLRIAHSDEARRSTVVSGAVELLAAQWAALVDSDAGQLLATAGTSCPATAWLCAFVSGATTQGCCADLEDVALAPVADGASVLVVARSDLPLRGREQTVLESLASLL